MTTKSDGEYEQAITRLTEFQTRRKKLAGELSGQPRTSHEEAISQLQRLRRESSRAKRQRRAERRATSPSIAR
jgi:hypothetical protein